MGKLKDQLQGIDLDTLEGYVDTVRAELKRPEVQTALRKTESDVIKATKALFNWLADSDDDILKP